MGRHRHWHLRSEMVSFVHLLNVLELEKQAVLVMGAGVVRFSAFAFVERAALPASWVTRVSLWAGGRCWMVVEQQVRPASHGTTCSSSQQPQSTLANYYQAPPQFLQLNTIHVRVSLATSQRPVCRGITTVSWAELP